MSAPLHDTFFMKPLRLEFTALAVALLLCVASGAFRKVAPDEAATIILALVDGLSLQLTFDRGLMTLPRAARVAETALLRYLSTGGPT